MVTKKAAGKRSPAKLKLRKETIRDLDAKGNAGKVKGGTAAALAFGAGPRKPPTAARPAPNPTVINTATISNLICG